MKRTVWVGAYSHPDLFEADKGFEGKGEGLYAFAFDAQTGALGQEAVIRGVLNPSFLALSRDGEALYCVHELDTFGGAEGGGVSAFDLKSGTPRRIASRPTHGSAPCHVAVSPSGRLLCAANYTGGSVSAFAIGGDGALSQAQVFSHTGSGPNAQRQDAPHVHSVWFTPSGERAVAMDLGTDTLTVYPVRDGTLLAEEAVLRTRPGDGPRMAAYHAGRNMLYVICELTSSIAAFACDEAAVPTRLLWTVSALAEGEAGAGDTAADIHISPDGRYLYTSVRGQDGLHVFAVGPDGGLTPVQAIPSGGKTPRGFALSPEGDWLLCGNQDGHTITVFAVDKETGRLTAHGGADCPSPVCLVFGA